MNSLFERMSQAQRIEPSANEDRLPHDRAVWRDYADEITERAGDPAPSAGGHRVSIDFGDGQITQSWGHLAHWHGAKRWRFGWPPA